MSRCVIYVIYFASLAICLSGALSKPNEVSDYDLCKNWRSYRGYHVPNPDNCKTYYQCQANRGKKGGYEAILRNCGTGTGFDPSLGICNDLNFLEGCIRLAGTLSQRKMGLRKRNDRFALY